MGRDLDVMNGTAWTDVKKEWVMDAAAAWQPLKAHYVMEHLPSPSGTGTDEFWRFVRAFVPPDKAPLNPRIVKGAFVTDAFGTEGYECLLYWDVEFPSPPTWKYYWAVEGIYHTSDGTTPYDNTVTGGPQQNGNNIGDSNIAVVNNMEVWADVTYRNEMGQSATITTPKVYISAA